VTDRILSVLMRVRGEMDGIGRERERITRLSGPAAHRRGVDVPKLRERERIRERPVTHGRIGER